MRENPLVTDFMTDFNGNPFPEDPFSENTNVFVKVVKPLPLSVRIWRMLRKLVRKRQESQAVAFQRSVARTAILDARRAMDKAEEESARHFQEVSRKLEKTNIEHSKAIDAKNAELNELRQKLWRETEGLREIIKRQEDDIKSYADLQIPKLERELQVSRAHIEQLEALLNNRLVTVETLTAINNQKIIEAETPPSVNQAQAYRQLVSGEFGMEKE